MSTFLLFCDLETTGLDTRLDEIIEAAFILTDTDLNWITSTEYLVRPSARAMDRALANEVVSKMHHANGLLADLREFWGLPVSDVEEDIQHLLAILCHGQTVYLAGSGVAAFDRPMIRQHMPALDKLLHYAPIDVGVLKRTWRMWTGHDISDDNDRKTHRAMADVEGHLNEARLFRDAFKAAAQ